MFRKARQLSIVEDLVLQIQDAIVTGDLKPGDKLPPTRELETTLGASRGTLREALRVLEQKGLIEVKVGAEGGVFIREANTEPISESLGLLIRQLKISFNDLADFRQVVEAGLIHRVVDRAGPEDIAELAAYVPELEGCVPLGADGWVKLLEVEVRTRKTLIAISGSRMYEAVLVPIHENMFAYVDRYLPGEKGLVQEAFEDWKIIIEAISRGDAETAAERTRDHIRRFAVHLEQGRQKTLDRNGEENESGFTGGPGNGKRPAP